MDRFLLQLKAEVCGEQECYCNTNVKKDAFSYESLNAYCEKNFNKMFNRSLENKRLDEKIIECMGNCSDNTCKSYYKLKNVFAKFIMGDILMDCLYFLSYKNSSSKKGCNAKNEIDKMLINGIKDINQGRKKFPLRIPIFYLKENDGTYKFELSYISNLKLVQNKQLKDLRILECHINILHIFGFSDGKDQKPHKATKITNPTKLHGKMYKIKTAQALLSNIKELSPVDFFIFEKITCVNLCKNIAEELTAFILESGDSLNSKRCQIVLSAIYDNMDIISRSPYGLGAPKMILEILKLCDAENFNQNLYNKLDCYIKFMFCEEMQEVYNVMALGCLKKIVKYNKATLMIELKDSYKNMKKVKRVKFCKTCNRGKLSLKVLNAESSLLFSETKANRLVAYSKYFCKIEVENLPYCNAKSVMNTLNEIINKEVMFPKSANDLIFTLKSEDKQENIQCKFKEKVYEKLQEKIMLTSRTNNIKQNKCKDFSMKIFKKELIEDFKESPSNFIKKIYGI